MLTDSCSCTEVCTMRTGYNGNENFTEGGEEIETYKQIISIKKT